MFDDVSCVKSLDCLSGLFNEMQVNTRDLNAKTQDPFSNN